jgi:LmbE family N-acetylglucosaminyl deacetylase
MPVSMNKSPPPRNRVNVLVIAPHPDDETLGCGGSLCCHSDQADHVSVVFLTSGELGLKALPQDRACGLREQEARQAARILGIESLFFLKLPDWCSGHDPTLGGERLAPVLQTCVPDLIYLPHPNDGHPDHQAAIHILIAGLQICRISEPILRAYEVWSPLMEFDVVQDITSVMSRKLRALRAHRSQLHDFNYVQAICGLNQYRGALAAKALYAEVFQTLELP